MEQLLFKAQGISQQQKKLMKISSLVMIVCGIAAMFFSQIEKKGISARFGSDYKTIGGGKIFDKDERSFIIFLGVAAIIIGIMSFEGMIYQDKSYICIYEYHIEVMVYLPVLFFIFNKTLNTSYDKIRSVQFNRSNSPLRTDSIFIVTDTERLGVAAVGIEHAYRYIMQKTHL